jgi:hypothetical protein
LCLQREGFFSDCKGVLSYEDEVINNINLEELKTYEDVYKKFLLYESKQHAKQIPCEQTPKNLFYLNNIFNLSSNTKVINMVRDPRDILNSQKNKWKRRFLGASEIPLSEAIRAWFNYHPITIALIWRSAIQEYKKFEKLNHNILTIKFEALLKEPSSELKKICLFLEIEYNEDMLNVPQIGSSDGKDSNIKGINYQRINPWMNSKSLSKTEIYFCEKYCSNEMYQEGYTLSGFKPNEFLIFYYYMTFPLKMSIALLFNIKRMKNLFGTINKYFFNKDSNVT